MDEHDDKVQINVQIPLSVREDFRAVAKFEGKSMSAMLYRYILTTIRNARTESPEIFPDYVEPPKIVGESEFEQIVYDTFDGKPVSPSQFRAIMQNLKHLLAVREISDEPPTGKVVARIEPGRKLTEAPKPRTINEKEIAEVERRVTPRKKKA